MTEKQYPNALQADVMLHWYQIRSVLGQGAFGITYLGHDMNLDRPVAIKEYLPGQLCTRTGDSEVKPLSEEHRQDFDWGLTRFINEARTLTKFEHPNLVRVFNVFEMHNTAYMVMNYEVGKSLQQILKNKKTMNEKELVKILVPLMSGLEIMHEKGFIHRDIKPGNIFIREDGSPVLLDFGSARQTRGRDVASTLTNFVSPGYAPIEQYASKSDRQGPWTDIYGLGATLYRVITGVSPTNAVDRSEMLMNGMEDDFKQLSEIAKGKYSDRLLKAIDHALAFNIHERPHTIAEWREEFGFEEDNIDTTPVPNPGQFTGNEATIKLDSPDTERTLALDQINQEPAAYNNEEATTINIAGDETADVHTIALTPVAKLKNILVRHKLPAAAIAVFILAAVSVVITNTMQKEVVQPAEETAVSEQQDGTMTNTAAPVETVAADNDAATRTGSGQAGQETENRIDELLSGAEEDIKSLRLTTPSGNNAYEKYRRILSMDQDNSQAEAGIRRISDTYVQLAEGAMQMGKTERAKQYLDNAEQLTPGSEKIAQARSRLETPADDESPGTAGRFINDVKDWFKNTARKENPDSDASSSSERVKRALGGR